MIHWILLIVSLSCIPYNVFGTIASDAGSAATTGSSVTITYVSSTALADQQQYQIRTGSKTIITFVYVNSGGTAAWDTPTIGTDFTGRASGSTPTGDPPTLQVTISNLVAADSGAITVYLGSTLLSTASQSLNVQDCPVADFPDATFLSSASCNTGELNCLSTFSCVCTLGATNSFTATCGAGSAWTDVSATCPAACQGWKSADTVTVIILIFSILIPTVVALVTIFQYYPMVAAVNVIGVLFGVVGALLLAIESAPEFQVCCSIYPGGIVGTLVGAIGMALSLLGVILALNKLDSCHHIFQKICCCLTCCLCCKCIKNTWKNINSKVQLISNEVVDHTNSKKDGRVAAKKGNSG